MEIPATPENRVLASAVNARIKSEARLLNARAGLYRLAGLGIACAFAGAGIGAALFGWTYARAPTVQADLVASAVARALEGLTLKTEGTVKLDPEARIGVARAETPTPTPDQLGAGARPDSQATAATNFTVFKNVPFGQGQVVTGWNFASSQQKLPTHQYCYYSEQLDGTSKVTIDLGENGNMVVGTQQRARIDMRAAYTNCVWFKAGAI